MVTSMAAQPFNALTPAYRAEPRSGFSSPTQFSGKHLHKITCISMGEGQANWLNTDKCHDRQVFSCTHDDSCTQPWIWLHVRAPSFFCVFFSQKYFMTCLFSCLRHSSAHRQSLTLNSCWLRSQSQLNEERRFKKPNLETEVKDGQEMK